MNVAGLFLKTRGATVWGRGRLHADSLVGARGFWALRRWVGQRAVTDPPGLPVVSFLQVRVSS